MVEIKTMANQPQDIWLSWVWGLYVGVVNYNLLSHYQPQRQYVAGVAAGKEICWLQNLLGELGYTAPAPSKLFIDNQSALSVAKNMDK